MKNGYEIFSENIAIKYLSADEGREGFCGDHCHDKYEITYLQSASGRYIVEGCEHKITSGTLIFIPPMSYHKVELSPDVLAEGYTVHFRREAVSGAVDAMFDKICADGEGHGRFYPGEQVCEALISAFDRFEMAERLKENERDAYMQTLLAEIIILLSATEGKQITVDEDEIGARVGRFLNANFRKNISLDRLARRFFVSKYYLCRAFKSYSGISIHAYINQKRIIYAKGLIESGMTASNAAEKVGFGDYSAFYRAYVKIVGKSPTA